MLLLRLLDYSGQTDNKKAVSAALLSTHGLPLQANCLCVHPKKGIARPWATVYTSHSRRNASFSVRRVTMPIIMWKSFSALYRGLQNNTCICMASINTSNRKVPSPFMMCAKAVHRSGSSLIAASRRSFSYHPLAACDLLLARLSPQ
jgi:hypothetical protein